MTTRNSMVKHLAGSSQCKPERATWAGAATGTATSTAAYSGTAATGADSVGAAGGFAILPQASTSPTTRESGDTTSTAGGMPSAAGELKSFNSIRYRQAQISALRCPRTGFAPADGGWSRNALDLRLPIAGGV